MNKASVVSWDAVPGAIDYEVVVVDSNGNANPPFLSPILNGVLSGGATQVLGVDLFGTLASGAYRIQVRAVAPVPADTSLYSDVINVNYDSKLPAPTNVQVT